MLTTGGYLLYKPRKSMYLVLNDSIKVKGCDGKWYGGVLYKDVKTSEVYARCHKDFKKSKWEALSREQACIVYLHSNEDT